jgi:hypothetical protein
MVMRPEDVSKSIDAAGEREVFRNIQEIIDTATLRARNANLPKKEVDAMLEKVREVEADSSKLTKYFPDGWISKALKQVLNINE